MKHACPLAVIPLLLALAGCAGPFSDSRLAAVTNPTDLSVELTVVGDPHSIDPLTHTSVYVLQPDRLLRVSVDPGPAHNLFPPPVAELSPAQIDQVVALLRNHRLMNEPSTPRAEAAAHAQPATSQAASAPAPPQAYLSVGIIAWGKTHRYLTTANESPATAEMLRLFVRVAGVEPVIPPTQPATP